MWTPLPRFGINLWQFAEKLEIGRAMRNIRIQSLMVANLSCVAQTGLESMLPIGTPRKPFSANCYVIFRETMLIISETKSAPLDYDSTIIWIVKEFKDAFDHTIKGLDRHAGVEGKRYDLLGNLLTDGKITATTSLEQRKPITCWSGVAGFNPYIYLCLPD